MQTEKTGFHATGANRTELWFFRAFLALALLTTAVVVAFFLIGLEDGSVSSFNLSSWLVVLAVVTSIPVAGIALRRSAHPLAGTLVLGVSALPALLYALFMLLVIATGERWN